MKDESSRADPAPKFTRRSHFEICMEIIELCQIPGLPFTRLMSKANISWRPLMEILVNLIEGDIIEVETRSLSFVGYKRETDYYIRTNEGDEIVSQFNELRERLPIKESQSKLKLIRSKQ